jgi:hypothetical protein|tara:strand:- start:244 stop:1035 length:792 start_codon:yes stop_codon:yes gene_type:complete
MTVVTPNVDTTIFPRVNFFKNFDSRVIRRGVNGRIYLFNGDFPIDTPNQYPAVNGSLEFEDLLPFPIDLGPDVSTQPTQVNDLRNPELDYLSDPNPFVNVYDLNPIHPNIDQEFYYPPESGSTNFSTALPFPVELGPDVTVTTTNKFDLRNGDSVYDFNPLEDLDDPNQQGIAFSNALPFPVDLGADVSTSTTNIYELLLGNSTYDLNPLQDTIDDAPYYPPVNGGVEFSNALPFPVELGPDASTSTTDIFELRLGDTSYDLN